MLDTTHPSFRQEIRVWSKIAAQTSARGGLELLPWFAALVIVGRGLGSQALAALSLAEAWGYCFVVAAWNGVYVTTMAFVSQSHGAGQITSARGWLIMSLLLVFGLNCLTAVAWFCTEPVLTGFGFDADLVHLGASYLVAAIPAIFAVGITVPIGAYLTAMQIAWLPPVLELTSSIVDVCASYICVLGIGSIAGMGLTGAGIGWDIGSTISAIQYCCALSWVWGREAALATTSTDDTNPHHDLHSSAHGGSAQGCGAHGGGARGGGAGEDLNEVLVPLLADTDADTSLSPTARSAAGATQAAGTPDSAAQGGGGAAGTDAPAPASVAAALAFVGSPRRWGAFLAQAGPNCGRAALDAGQYTALSFLAARLGAEPLAAHNTMLCVLELANTATQGMAEATVVRVGHHLGRRDAAAARRVAGIATTAAAAWGAAAAAVGYVWAKEITSVFTDDPLVHAAAAEVAPLLWGSYALMAVGQQILGVLDGSCRGREQAWVFVVGVWLVGVPAAAASAAWAPRLGLRGLWGGLLAGYAVVLALGAVLVARSDWDRLAAAAEWLATTGAARDPALLDGAAGNDRCGGGGGGGGAGVRRNDGDGGATGRAESGLT